MRDHGREDRDDGGGSRIAASVTAPGAGSEAPRPDLVFDFSGMDDMTVQDLSVLLTAQRLASSEDRTVWVTGVAHRTWYALDALGLARFFRPFPDEEGPEA